ncbi:winged helix-turn-helix transcriptional regulator [Escherichia coli]|uniref:winged helix-turn-helix transcriptional regulator n=1 Tax=Escherichia coli TaxID=562 RepID=UPI0005A997F1|nr:winged helix-turn-helix transcriptional regulator [Escherichia coli]EFB3017602.1 winged helix-turn-helix transcriptional regulator [Escherichia coli]EFI0265612.1 winged helix-turn-helix transcriptional regulator [Escherichia coli]EFQ5434527.1 winged helix-turn-helix transcriptional regulator [Escherichia coli]EKX1230229.1 winged helix-turn-helix transcriptional regulator [Escherichia coli]EKX3438089.1 winged helix-turn-helix transcriptional regulator [Escherichia coli]
MSKLSEEACDVLECLMASGRNSARGVAEVLQMSPAMVIEILKKLEAEGLITQLNGFWSVPEEKTPEVKNGKRG